MDFLDSKVIHLVRDPRGRYRSLYIDRETFPKAFPRFADTCDWQVNSLRLAQILPPEK